MATDSEQMADRLLIAMEDERDAALLEVGRLKLEVAALEQTVHHLLDQRDKLIEKRDAERALRIGFEEAHMQAIRELLQTRPVVEAAKTWRLSRRQYEELPALGVAVDEYREWEANR
jgi:hypothetical protein